MVSEINMVTMGVAAAVGILVPIGLGIMMRRNWKSVLTGVGVFVIAALVLECMVHKLVLAGEIGTAIKGNVYYLALYGGLMAGVFEEGGRFLAMKYVLKRNGSALAYGIGHGGIECLVILGLGMISSLTLAVTINNGGSEAILAQLNGAAKVQLETAIGQLESASAGLFLISIWERFSALILQISLSVFVWYSVGKRWWLLTAAILLHAAVDAVAVMMKDCGSYVMVEAIICSMAIAIAAMAFMIWKKQQ